MDFTDSCPSQRLSKPEGLAVTCPKTSIDTFKNLLQTPASHRRQGLLSNGLQTPLCDIPLKYSSFWLASQSKTTRQRSAFNWFSLSPSFFRPHSPHQVPPDSVSPIAFNHLETLPSFIPHSLPESVFIPSTVMNCLALRPFQYLSLSCSVVFLPRKTCYQTVIFKDTSSFVWHVLCPCQLYFLFFFHFSHIATFSARFVNFRLYYYKIMVCIFFSVFSSVFQGGKKY